MHCLWELTMKQLDLDRINEYAPYKLEQEGDIYLFETDFGIQYAVWFEQDPVSTTTPAYWFNLTNHSQKASPNDTKIRSTVIFIVEDFFRSNPDILLYMCDNANEQQAMRSRLFLRWFNAYGQQLEYYTRTEMVKDGEEENYIAIILKRSHPQFQEIIDLFDKQIAMFRANKP